MQRAVIGAGLVLAVAAGLAGCGRSADGDASTRDVTVKVTQLGDSAKPSRADAQAWPDAWCSLQVGAARADVRDAMGKPTSSFDDQDAWEGYGLHLTAFYGADLRARQLDVSAGSVPCATSRRR